MTINWLGAIAVFLFAACTAPLPNGTKPAAPTPGGRVLVVANERSPDGLAVADYYMKMREVPPTNFVSVNVGTDDEISAIEFRLRILDPVRDAIERMPQRIDFILLTTGVPLRIGNNRGYSVDAHLAGMRLAMPPMVGFDSVWLSRFHNPYFNSHEPFDSDRFSMYLVTRLDCAKVDDCMALVDRSLGARPQRGPFFFDAARPRHDADDGYAIMNRTLIAAHRILSASGFQSVLDTTSTFIGPPVPLAGYASWGSNDARFRAESYHHIRFLPGAIAETFVSTSARTFRQTSGGQSRIVDLIEQGVTGVKGYVSEPYTVGLARPEILFDRYVHGFTLAESFYAASRMVLWKDIVIGDPLCAPYSHINVSLPGSFRGM